MSAPAGTDGFFSVKAPPGGRAEFSAFPVDMTADGTIEPLEVTLVLLQLNLHLAQETRCFGTGIMLSAKVEPLPVEHEGSTAGVVG